MPTQPDPTEPNREVASGRIALWLDPDDLAWLGLHCQCTDETPAKERERCARIRFRAQAALHKSGAKDIEVLNPELPLIGT